MRLRYLQVHNQSPLRDIEIVFGRNQILDRSSSVHFVVGVNGSGKTRLLQLLADIFVKLQWQQLPYYSFVLAYDLGKGEQRRTIIIQRKDGPLSNSRLIEFATYLPEYSAGEWQHLLEARSENGAILGNLLRDEPFPGDALPGIGSIQRYVPWTLVYTSGAIKQWRTYFFAGSNSAESALPPYDPDASVEAYTIPWDRVKAFKESTSGNSEGQHPPKALLIELEDLKYALCAVSLKQAITDFGGYFGEEQQAHLAADTDQDETGSRGQSRLRGLLNEVGWLWPVSVTLTINLSPEEWKSSQTILQMQDLYRQASAVVAEPQSPVRRFVFDLLAKARAVDEEGKTLEKLSDVTYIAEAIYRILGQASENPEPTAFDIFRQLKIWQQQGILLDLVMTFRKQHVDSLLRYEWLSDGERFFLGRMALFQLLSGQDDVLFILDEPETHFNDVWKREIVDIIDDSLHDDASEVVIATHSSIALTDVFDEEIVLLIKEDGNTVASNVRTPTFGADPSEIMVNVFGAEDSIGKRALEFLELWLNKDWTPDERELLERIVKNVGPGLHRSELREILRELNAASNSRS